MTTTSTTAVAAGRAGHETDQTGIMVALVLDPDKAADLTLDPIQYEGAICEDDLHVTLVYLGDVASVEDPSTFLIDVLTVVRDVARAHGPIEGAVSGVGRFALPDETGAFYASYDAPLLSTLREDLVAALREAALPVKEDHGFDPHITLAYLPPGATTPDVRVPTKTLNFADLTVAFGNSRIPVPLRKRDVVDDATPLLERDMPDTTAPNSPIQAKGKFVPFKKGGGKGEAPGIARGAYVTLGSEKGRVDLVVTSGKVPGVEQDVEGTPAAPAIRVVIYEKTGNGWKATGRKIGAKAKSAKHTFPLKSPKAGGGARGKKTLVELLAEHEEHVEAKALPAGAVPSGRAVSVVFDRGVASWPGEDATVLDADEWGAARVETFLKVARGEVDPHETGYVRDLDVLPVGHPWRE